MKKEVGSPDTLLICEGLRAVAQGYISQWYKDNTRCTDFEPSFPFCIQQWNRSAMLNVGFLRTCKLFLLLYSQSVTLTQANNSVLFNMPELLNWLVAFIFTTLCTTISWTTLTTHFCKSSFPLHPTSTWSLMALHHQFVCVVYSVSLW